MTPKEKMFHIYAKDRCLFHNIKEEEFRVTWNTLKGIVGLMQTDYTCLLYTSPSPRDVEESRMPSSA